MSIDKHMLHRKKMCKVKFSVPKYLAENSKTAYLVGDFNGWDTSAIPMKRNKNGSYHVTLELESGKEYQFRYFLDEHRWENDIHADKFAPSGYSDAVNSVLSV
jgi:1,4-alpha-glucan branching enzyme